MDYGLCAVGGRRLLCPTDCNWTNAGRSRVWWVCGTEHTSWSSARAARFTLGKLRIPTSDPKSSFILAPVAGKVDAQIRIKQHRLK